MGVKVREEPKGSGVWYVFINHNGTRKAKKIGRDKRLAREVARKVEAKLTLGYLNIEDSKKLSTFEYHAKEWLGYIQATKKDSTYERYKVAMDKHVSPSLGHIQVDKVTRGNIRDLLIAKLNEGYAKSGIALMKDVISGTFNHLIDEELLSVNPADGITKRLGISKKDKKPDIEPLAREEVILFLDTCLEHYPEYYPFFLCALRTGMRLGELLALEWSDVDFNSRYLWVRQSYRRGIFATPKSGKSRKVDMSNQLKDTLKTLMTKRKKEALKKGTGEVTDLVFCNSNKVIEQNYIRRVFKRALSKAGLREIRLHDLRHTYASLLLTQGESPVYVKEQLGHHSIQITVDIYGHLIPGANREAVNKLDNLQANASYPQVKINNKN